jgi:hypothetical protein
MAAFLIALTFAVDYGRVQVAKTELDAIATATARAAGYALLEGGNASDVYKAAQAVANRNRVDGRMFTINNSQVILGVYDPAVKTFYATNDFRMANAVQVKLDHRMGQTGSPSMWSRLMGAGDMNLNVVSMVMVTGVPDQWVTYRERFITPATTTTTPSTTSSTSTAKTTTSTAPKTTTTASKTTTSTAPKTTTTTPKTTTSTAPKTTTATAPKTSTTSTPAKTTSTPSTTTTVTTTQKIEGTKPKLVTVK